MEFGQLYVKTMNSWSVEGGMCIRKIWIFIKKISILSENVAVQCAGQIFFKSIFKIYF